MPIIAAYFGVSGVSFIVETSDSFDHFSFPYSYTFGCFSNCCSEEQFYEDLIANVLKSKKLNIKDYDLIYTGFVSAPNLKGTYHPLKDVISNIKEYNPILMNLFSVMTKNQVISSVNVSYEDEANYYANLSIYPQIIPTDPSTQTDVYMNLSKKFELIDYKNLFNNKPLVFTGGIFSTPTRFNDLRNILTIDFIRYPGVYEVYLDYDNSIILSSLINLSRKSQLSPKISKLCSVVKSNGSAEVLLTSSLNTSQFIEVPKDSIVVVPFNSRLDSKLEVKTNSTLLKETRVEGGFLGLIFDSRSDYKNLFSDVKSLNNCLDQIRKTYQDF